MIEYQGYTGVFEFDPEMALFAGHVVDLRDEIYFEGESVDELTDSMRRAVDHYLSVCEMRGDQPERPFSGRFNVRVEPATHRRISAAAAAAGLSMNEWITGLVTSRLSAIDRAAEVLVLDNSRKAAPSRSRSPVGKRSARARKKTPAKSRATKATAAKVPTKGTRSKTRSGR